VKPQDQQVVTLLEVASELAARLTWISTVPFGLNGTYPLTVCRDDNCKRQVICLRKLQDQRLARSRSTLKHRQMEGLI
jgi:hypothetical protein